MKISSPKDLFSFLASIDAAPKKSLSQNFLVDSNVLRRIVDLAGVQKGDVVLEIGPGPGALTWELLDRGAHVFAIEKDRKLAKALERYQTSDGRLTIREADVLTVNLNELLNHALKPGVKAKVVANLPYQLTTPIFALLAPLHELISDVVVMVQDEVALRVSASPGGRDYGSITAFLNFYGSVSYGFKVSRNCFYPKPKIDSAIIKLSLAIPPACSNSEALFQMIRTAFQQRRKMMRGSLKTLYPSQAVEQGLSSLGLDPQSRPERLSIHQFIDLYEFLASWTASTDQDQTQTQGDDS